MDLTDLLLMGILITQILDLFQNNKAVRIMRYKLGNIFKK